MGGIVRFATTPNHAEEPYENAFAGTVSCANNRETLMLSAVFCAPARALESKFGLALWTAAT